MKTCVLSQYFVCFAICFIMVLSSCDVVTETNESPEGTLSHFREMLPGETYKFEAKVTDPDGDPLTYSWSVEESLSEESLSGPREWVQGELHSNNSPVVSYTAPHIEIADSGSDSEWFGVQRTRPKEVDGKLTVRLVVSDGIWESTWSVVYYWRHYLHWSTE